MINLVKLEVMIQSVVTEKHQIFFGDMNGETIRATKVQSTTRWSEKKGDN